MKKFLCLLLCLLFMLAGCKKEEKLPPAYPLEAFGMNFEERPSAVVSLNPSGEEIMNVLGYGHVLKNTDEAFFDKDYPEINEILKLEPDLVLLSPDTRESIAESLEERNIKCITVDRFYTDDELLSFLKEFSLIFEGLNDWDLKKEQLNFYFSETSDILVSEGKRLIEENVGTAPTFLFVLGENFALSDGNAEADFLESIGMVNMASKREGLYFPFSELPNKPDILIYPSHLPEIAERLGGNLEAPYDYARFIARSPAVFNARRQLLENIFGEDIEVEGNFLPMPEIPEEEE